MVPDVVGHEEDFLTAVVPSKLLEKSEIGLGIENLVEPVMPFWSTGLCDVKCAEDLRGSSNRGALYDRSDANSGPGLSQGARLLEDRFVLVEQHAATGPD